jgi:hypothetical protein
MKPPPGGFFVSNLQALKWYALKATERYDMFIKTQSVYYQIKSVLLGFPFLTSAIKAVRFRNITTHNDDAINRSSIPACLFDQHLLRLIA